MISVIVVNLIRVCCLFCWLSLYSLCLLGPLNAASSTDQESALFDSSQIEFSQVETQNLAIFTRHGWLWFVFDSPTVTVQEGAGITVENGADYTVIKLKGMTSIPHISITNNIWHVDFDKPSNILVQPIQPVKNSESVFIAASGRLFRIMDGKTPLLVMPSFLFTTPANYSGGNIKNDYDFILYNLKTTANGILIEPKSSNIEITHQENGISIRNATASIKDEIAEDEKINVILPFSKWLGNGDQNYYDAMIALQSRIINAGSPASAYYYRCKLAKFYLANGLVPEAVALLTNINRLHSELLEDPEFANEYNLLFFVSLYLAGQNEQATTVFDRIDQHWLSPSALPELNFWHDALNVQMGRSNISLQYIENLTTFLPYYLNYNKKFGFIALKNAVDNRNIEQAQQILSVLVNMALTERENHYLLILQADVFFLNKQFDNAKKLYEKIETSAVDDPKNRALATYRKVSMLYQEEMISLSDAISALEPLLIVWRGDNFSPKLRTFLASLYIADERYFKGLDLLRKTAIFDARNADLLAITAKMNKTFMDLFYYGGAKSMSPFAAASLFYYFRELTPIGDVGVQVTLGLIDHLVELDLIERATLFLNHLVKYRMTIPLERALYALKLAKLYFYNQQVDQTLDIISENIEVLTANLPNDTKYLRAEALAALNNDAAVLSLLDNDNSDRANKIKSDLLWQKLDCNGLQNFLRPKLEYRESPKKKLSQLEEEYVFRLATCYVRVGNNNLAVKLYNTFYLIMGHPFYKNALAGLMKISYTDNLASLRGFVEQAKILHSKTSRSVTDDQFIQQFE